jgi:hypothetical protein
MKRNVQIKNIRNKEENKKIHMYRKKYKKEEKNVKEGK